MEDDNQELRDHLKKLREDGHFVFIPAAALPLKNGLFIPSVQSISMTADDYYPTQKKFGLNHFAMMKLADAAGVQWVSNEGHVGRVDNRANPDYCSFRVVARIRTAEGLWLEVPAHKHLDLDAKKTGIESKHAGDFDYKKKFGGGKGPNGWDVKKPWPANKKEYIEKYTERDVGQLRDHIDERCESGAQVRAIRNILHLPSNFPADTNNDKIPANLNRKFCIVRYVLDPTNTHVQNAQLNSLNVAYGQIYGNPAPAHLPQPVAPPQIEQSETPPAGSGDDESVIDLGDREFMEKSFGEKLNAIKTLVESSNYRFFDQDTAETPLEEWTDDGLLDYFKHLKKEAAAA